MWYSNIDVLYVPTGLKKKRTRMSKSSILERMHSDDKSVFASNIMDQYENRPDNLHSVGLADFSSSYINKESLIKSKATLFQ